MINTKTTNSSPAHPPWSADLQSRLAHRLSYLAIANSSSLRQCSIKRTPMRYSRERPWAMPTGAPWLIQRDQRDLIDSISYEVWQLITACIRHTMIWTSEKKDSIWITKWKQHSLLERHPICLISVLPLPSQGSLQCTRWTQRLAPNSSLRQKCNSLAVRCRNSLRLPCTILPHSQCCYPRSRILKTR